MTVLMWHAAAVAVAAIVGAAADAAVQTPDAAQRRPAQPGNPPTVLFLCPHGAAKSVLASAYFQRLARERGLNVRVESAGTDPEATVSSAVAAHLEKNGYEVPVATPRQVTLADLTAADVVISIGCDLRDLPAPRGSLRKWDDVPALSEDFSAADAAIRKRVADLVDELIAQIKIVK